MFGQKWNLVLNGNLLSWLAAAIVLAAVCTMGCGGSDGGGGGSDDDPSPDGGETTLFQGDYSQVRFSSDRGGAATNAKFTSGIGYADFDGDSNVTAGITATANGQPLGEAFFPGSVSGTYAVDTYGALTVDGRFSGYVGTDASILLTTDPIPEDPTYMETGITVFIEEAVGASDSLLDGRYSFVRFSCDRGGEDTNAEFTSGIGYFDFDGAGAFSGATTATADGQADGAAFLPGAVSGTYGVDTEGEVDFDNGVIGYVSPDGSMLIWTDPIPEDPTYRETGIAIAFKEGTAMSNSSLSGRFYFVRFSSDRGGSDTDAEFTSGVGYVDFDGAGGFSGAITATANGQTTGEAFLPGAFSGTYTVAANGAVTIEGTTFGFVSADGNVIAWTDPIPEDPTYMETGIAIGIKTD